LKKKEIVELLSLKEPEAVRSLYERAYATKLKTVGNKVYFRGIIEYSNICTKNCYYCGIRRENQKNSRYEMSSKEVIEAGLWAFENRYGSVVIQSGERNDKQFVDKIKGIIKELKTLTSGKLGITLSLGEQSREVFEEWYVAGAHRYLLRIETTNPELYSKCHPSDHSMLKRLDCLRILKEIGYQTGTGVMIGLPGQTLSHLADDILFFRDFDIDMIGMGPYVIHQETPFSRYKDKVDHEENLQLSLKMIAITRLIMPDINIASTTALQAINPQGREMGLKAGANIIMPVITDIKYRKSYQLYNNKPCLDENSDMCKSCLEGRIATIGEEIGYSEWGDSPHFTGRKNDKV
jgi:biotin synthase